MTRALLALVLLLAFGALGFGWRTAVQVRRHGDTGWRFSRGGLDRLVGAAMALGAGLLCLGPVWALVAGHPAVPLGLDAVASSGAALVVGLALTVGAGAVTVVAQLQMGASWRIGVQDGEVTALVTTGLFARVRNPIFTGMVAFSLGLALLVPNLPTLLGAVVAVAAIEVQVRLVEEPNLVVVHGEPYRRWAAATGRFVPGLGRGV